MLVKFIRQLATSQVIAVTWWRCSLWVLDCGSHIRITYQNVAGITTAWRVCRVVTLSSLHNLPVLLFSR